MRTAAALRPAAAALRPAAAAALLLAALAAAAAPAAAAPAGEGAPPAGRFLSLDEAIAMALEQNDAIVIEREALASARSAETGARGVYDPAIVLRGGWRRATEPVNSAISGAPAGEAAPTVETADAGAEVRQYLPAGGSVTFSMTAARETTDSFFTLLSPAYGTKAGLEFRQPILRDRATDAERSAIRIAASEGRRAAASLGREVADAVAEVERAYWTLVAARREVDVRDEAVRLASEQLEQTRIRIEKGALPETELAQPRAELERRRGESFAAREAVARAESALKVLILDDGGGDAAAWSERLVPADDPAIPVAPVDVAAAMDRALASRPEIREAEAVRERRRAESALARDAVRPALDAVASYARFGLAGSLNPSGLTLPGVPSTIPAGMEGSLGRSLGMLDEDRFDDARVGLEFSVPIGNRAARAGAAGARSAERQADAGLSRARKQVRAEVLDAAAALETAGQRIEAARSAREAAEVQLAAERERFAAGLSTNFLVLTRQNDLSGARLDEIAALTDYRRARAEMARVTGSLLEERGIEVDEDGIFEPSGVLP